MNVLFLFAAPVPPQAAGGGGALDLVLLAVVGILVVFAALGIIGGLMVVLGRLLSKEDAEAPAEAPAAAPAGAIDPQTLVVLSAAAYAAVGRPLRIRRVTFIDENTVSAWKEAGRVAVQSSHNLRRPL